MSANASSDRGASAPTASKFAPPLSALPFPLRANLVRYLIAGGDLLPRFLGREPDPADKHPPSQMWLASTVASAVGDGRAGLSRLTEEDGGGFLKDLIESAPEAFLGQEHVARHGATPGYLLKLLNSRERLLVQVHPDKERARRHFHSEFGKTEAWYIVDAEEGALVYAGFKPGVTRETWKRAILSEDSELILGLLHAFPVRPGEVLFIPAGLPHALGKGSLALEIQEPTDITLRAERRLPSGELLPEEVLHAGRGLEVLLDCFDYRAEDEAAARRRLFVRPAGLFRGGGLLEESLIAHSLTPCFAMDRLSLAAGARREKANAGFLAAVVLGGRGRLEAAGRVLPLKRGSELFLPRGVGGYAYVAEEELSLVECRPPLSGRAAEGATWV